MTCDLFSTIRLVPRGDMDAPSSVYSGPWLAIVLSFKSLLHLSRVPMQLGKVSNARCGTAGKFVPGEDHTLVLVSRVVGGGGVACGHTNAGANDITPSCPVHLVGF